MAPLQLLAKETMKDPKLKKDKTTKKRKASELVESMPSASAGVQSAAVSEPTAIQTSQSPHSGGESPHELKASSKTKKDKSSKKRKASDMDEPAHIAAEHATSTNVPDAASSPKSDTDILQEPASKKRKCSVEEIEVDVTAPEPPSKKTLRRLKKGKPLPPSKSGVDSTPESEPKKKAEVEKRSEHGVWIGNMPWSVSKDDLRTFLIDHSEITSEMITRVHMPGPNDSKPANKVEKNFGKVQHNKGFAYVDFSTAEAVEKAVELSEQLMSGRRLLIKNQKSFEGRPEKTKEETRNDGKPPSTRIFMGNLSYDITEDILKDHFEKCGAIESVKVATFEDSGKCKGYAWIVFEELEAAQNAVRGFVRIEEASSDVSQSDDEDDSDREGKVSKPKKTKTIKRWVNKIKGRPLRMEFAEGADVRYKKRYGKDGTKNAHTGAFGASGEEVKEKALRSAPEFRPSEGVSYDRPYGAPRLTGGIVKSEGKKVTF
ncbi:Nucleolar 13 [Hyphodiscus hymeniophilus]|uniref:Nucleolar 13 n=1 Tax=Hyphodiscus hymeniophilus TaxID=353542 RepID=A0A9P6VPG3_9HELO|nr:Nucleolar 13 [Hyphodiscus hymeniophilus]